VQRGERGGAHREVVHGSSAPNPAWGAELRLIGVDKKSPGWCGRPSGASEWKEEGEFKLSRAVGKKLKEELGSGLNRGGAWCYCDGTDSLPWRRKVTGHCSTMTFLLQQLSDQ
jgi:hypothetical protein